MFDQTDFNCKYGECVKYHWRIYLEIVNEILFGIKFRKGEISDFAVDGYIIVFWCADYEYDNENHRQGHFQGHFKVKSTVMELVS